MTLNKEDPVSVYLKSRNSMAFYYYRSDVNPERRRSTLFTARPGIDPVTPELEQLRRKRLKGRL
jgi:hypothetical protein